MLPSATCHCPYCGEPIELLIDDSVEHQDYIEDCQVCCRPIRVAVAIVDGEPQLTTSAENE